MIYLDSSALVKLVTRERESAALFAHVTESKAQAISSTIAQVEVMRAMRRAKVSRSVEARADDVLSSVGLIELDSGVVELATRVAPLELRSLDAIHLASALSVADTLEAFIAYDQRLVTAATNAGLQTLSPS